ncbi:MAG: helix-hairpin-helix domain-containing protein [Anaerocolumna sp.]
MEKRNFLKTGIILLLIVLAGIFYSCRDVKEPNISLQDDFANQTAEGVTKEPVADGQTDEKLLTVDDQRSSETTTADITEVNQTAKGQEADQSMEKAFDVAHEYIYIYICGAVREPDVYEVDTDTRLVDVIKLAGGLSEDAAGDYVNQAALVEDGQKVYIPTKDEVKGILPDGFLYNDSNQPDTVNETISSEVNAAGATASAGKVNINKASSEELMTLAGIGESKAESIIAYRQEHGSFKRIEEIKNISGIKDSVFNKISDMITVN